MESNELHLWNPLTRDITVKHAEGHNGQHEFTAKHEKITTFPYKIGLHVRKYLVGAILDARNLPHFDANIAEVEKEVTRII